MVGLERNRRPRRGLGMAKMNDGRNSENCEVRGCAVKKRTHGPTLASSCEF